MSGKFEITHAKDGDFHFHLKAANGQIILTSQMYTAKASAEEGIASVKKNASDDKNYERKDTKNNEYMFNLKAHNHQVIGTSQVYTTTEARENGIESVKTNAPKAPVEDLSA